MKRTIALSLALAFGAIACVSYVPCYAQESAQPPAANKPAGEPDAARIEKRKQRREQIKAAVKKKAEEIKAKAGAQTPPAQ